MGELARSADRCSLRAQIVGGQKAISFAKDALRDGLAPNGLDDMSHGFQLFPLLHGDLPWRSLTDGIFHDELVGAPLMMDARSVDRGLNRLF